MGAWNTAQGGRQFGDNGLSRGLALSLTNLKQRRTLLLLAKEHCQTFRAKGKDKALWWKCYKISGRTELKLISEYKIFNISCGFMRIEWSWEQYPTVSNRLYCEIISVCSLKLVMQKEVHSFIQHMLCQVLNLRNYISMLEIKWFVFSKIVL